jgi:hypothetical protein
LVLLFTPQFWELLMLSATIVTLVKDRNLSELKVSALADGFKLTEIAGIGTCKDENF